MDVLYRERQTDRWLECGCALQRETDRQVFAPSRLERTTGKSETLINRVLTSYELERVLRGGSSLQTTPTKVPIGKSTPGGYAPYDVFYCMLDPANTF